MHCVSAELSEARAWPWAPEAGTVGICEPPCECMESNLGSSLQEQKVLLIAEPSLLSHCVPVFKNYSVFFIEIVLTKMSICLLARMKESFNVD